MGVRKIHVQGELEKEDVWRGRSNSEVPHRLTLRPHTTNTIPYQPLTGGSRPSSLGWVPCLCRCRRASPASPPDPGH